MVAEPRPVALERHRELVADVMAGRKVAAFLLRLRGAAKAHPVLRQGESLKLRWQPAAHLESLLRR